MTAVQAARFGQVGVKFECRSVGRGCQEPSDRTSEDEMDTVGGAAAPAAPASVRRLSHDALRF